MGMGYAPHHRELTGGTKAPTLTEALTLVMSPNADLFLGPPWGEDEDRLA